jgi:hypothetical protein
MPLCQAQRAKMCSAGDTTNDEICTGPLHKQIAPALTLRALQVRAGFVEEIHSGNSARGFIVEEDRDNSVKGDDSPERAGADRWQCRRSCHSGKHRDCVPYQPQFLHVDLRRTLGVTTEPSPNLSREKDPHPRRSAASPAAKRARRVIRGSGRNILTGAREFPYSPVQLGLRFCENANGPSTASLDLNSFDCNS